MNFTAEYLEWMYNASRSPYYVFWSAVYQSPEFWSVPTIQKVWFTCLVLLGGFGNVATIFVLRRMKDSDTSQHVFLLALAVVDLYRLYSGVLVHNSYLYFRVNVVDLHTATCKLFKWLSEVATAQSVWLVTAVTVQRTLAVTWPHKVRVMCTVRRTWTVVAALVCTACAFYSDYLVMNTIRDNECFYYETVSSYKFYLQHISTWLNLSLASFLPFVCILVCDVILSLSLFRSFSASSVANQAITNAPSAHSQNSRRKTAKTTTVMILALSISFLILTLPVRIVVMWHNLSANWIYSSTDPKLYVTFYIMQHIGDLLVDTNSAINFFLYCFTGTRFRREFLSWIRCRATDHSSRSVGKTACVSSKGERTKQHDSTQGSRT